ncbi:MAG TPA: hypothetical protein VN704_12760 [Verrucomicrobiae bacterium]|nr:hypothetical protein [Verrucomicrobiae bacterium]
MIGRWRYKIKQHDNSNNNRQIICRWSYDSNNIFKILAENGILPCIKVRKNSRVRWKKGNILRNLSVLAQKNGL